MTEEDLIAKATDQMKSVPFVGDGYVYHTMVEYPGGSGYDFTGQPIIKMPRLIRVTFVQVRYVKETHCGTSVFYKWVYHSNDFKI